MDSRANISSTTEVSRVARVFVTIRLQPREQLTIRLLGEIRGIERADGRRSLGGGSGSDQAMYLFCCAFRPKMAGYLPLERHFRWRKHRCKLPPVPVE
jgi:hypothetical protein